MLLNKARQRPIKGYADISQCPDCEGLLIAKCGEIKTWHWAHRVASPNCETAPESEWHMGWKQRFPDEWLEVRYSTGRADVMLPSGDAVEFQSKGLDSETLRTRKAGISPKRIAWVVDGREAFSSGRLDLRNYNYDPEFGARKYFCTFRWKQLPNWFLNDVEVLLIDVGQNSLTGEPGLLDIRKIYPGPPTGGYGFLRTHDDFVDWCKQRKSLNFAMSWLIVERAV